MARLQDIPEPTRSAVDSLPCPAFDTNPAVAGPPLAQRKVAIVSSAALIQAGEKPFAIGSAEFRVLSAELDSAKLLTSHVSINFDRAAFQRDANVVYPLDRLRDMARDGEIGAVAENHYTIMGSTDPALMLASADQMAASMHAEGVNAVVLTPV